MRAERQATFIMATHDAHIAARARRVMELVDGQLANLDMETDWEARYQSHDMPWEKGEASPGLVDFLAGHPRLPRGTVLVPGCGTGHDARAWAAAGFAVTGCDIAPSAIRLAREKTAAAGLSAEFILGDFLADAALGPYDWIFEHTLFCAIDPARRDDYVQRRPAPAQARRQLSGSQLFDSRHATARLLARRARNCWTGSARTWICRRNGCRAPTPTAPGWN